MSAATTGCSSRGLDHLQAVVDGILPPPPISGLVGMRAPRVAEGEVEFRCELVATGRVTRRGRRASFADGEVRDDQGRLVATASSNCVVFAL